MNLGRALTGIATGGLSEVYNTAKYSGIADFIPGIGDAKAQDKANKINQQEAQINRDFQERMSSTAYQRAMDDMRKAGLNPYACLFTRGGICPHWCPSSS